VTNDYSNLAVCTEDFTLKGMYKGKEHRCRCQPKDEQWRDREWAGYDIAAELDLCHLCVRTPVRSGTRWSWLACESCRSADNQIANTTLGESGPRNKILNLGRHSMMNGISLRIEDAQGDNQTKRFVKSVMEVNSGWIRLFAWKDEEAQRLFEASGFDNLESVPLDRWLETNRASQGASVDAWCRFFDKDLPHLAKFDELRNARQTYLDRSDFAASKVNLRLVDGDEIVP
jgi:hypothetical protein